jgi:monovalent cation:H+ antiporter-2, CPA2 family
MFDNPVVIIAVLVAAAVVGGMIAHRFRQPVILGYLLIGVVVGPHALGLVSDIGIVEVLATIGVTLLMFTLGLETSFGQLRQIGKVGFLGGILQIVITFGLGLLVGFTIFRWPLGQSAIFGLIISMSSTAVCLKILMERGELDSVHGRIMIAILILQDLSVVVMTVIIPLIGSNIETLSFALLIALGKALLFVAGAIALGLWILPWLMGRVGGVRTRELFLMTVLGLCLGGALSTQIFGLSAVFGAFLIGLVLHESKFAHQALAEITPLRDIFATLFFVSLGMLFDPRFLLHNWGMVLITVAVIIIVKFSVVFGIVRMFRYSQGIAAITAVGLIQLGEFGFILAQAAQSTGTVSDQFYSLILACAIITMLFTPVAISLAGRFYRELEWAPSFLPVQRRSNQSISAAGVVANEGHVILAGYGRIGLNMARGLQNAGLPYIVIDIDPERVEAARKMGQASLHGDASNPVVLAAANINQAKVVAVTFPDPIAVVGTVKTALEMNPKLKVVARVHRAREAVSLEGLEGVQLVSPEYEASLEFVKRTLEASGWKQTEIGKTMPLVEKDKELTEFSPDNEH